LETKTAKVDALPERGRLAKDKRVYELSTISISLV